MSVGSCDGSAVLDRPADAKSHFSDSGESIDEELIAREGFRTSFRRDLARDGRRLEIEATAAQLRLEPSPDGDVHIDADLAFRSSDARWTERARERFGGKLDESSSRVRLTLDAPRRPNTIRATVQVQASFSDVRVREVEGNLEVRNESGGIEAREIGGNVVTHGTFSPVNVGEARRSG